MTEAEWFACNDPCDLHDFLKEKLGIPRQGEISSRKWRLLAVACCRRFSHLLLDERSSTALDVAEQLADGNATPAELEVAYRAAEVAWDLGPDDDPWEQRQLYIRSRDEENRDLAERWVACAAMHTAELKCWFGFEDTERAAEAEGAGDWHYMRRDAARASPRRRKRTSSVIFSASTSIPCNSTPPGSPGTTARSARWHRSSTTPAPSTACRCSPTPSKTPAAPTPPSCLTAANRANTSAAAGWSICCWARADYSSRSASMACWRRAAASRSRPRRSTLTPNSVRAANGKPSLSSTRRAGRARVNSGRFARKKEATQHPSMQLEVDPCLASSED